MPTITPTVGRKVHFWSSDPVFNRLNASVPMDATVIYVWGPGMVNLDITDHQGVRHFRSSVSLSDPQGHESHENGQYATWMPFQVGQAKAQAAA